MAGTKKEKVKTNLGPADVEIKKTSVKVAEILKPQITQAIDFKIDQKIKPLEHKIDDFKITISNEIKNLVKTMNPKVNPQDIEAGKKIDPMFAQQQQPQQQQQPPNTQNMIQQMMNDPQLKQMMSAMGMNPSGAPGSPNPMTPPMMAPPAAGMSEEDRKLYQQNMMLMMLPQLLQSLGPLIQPQGGFAQELLMRKMMSSMAYEENFNRGMMGFFAKAIFKDPSIAENFMRSSMQYMAPVTDTHLYNPNLIQNPAGVPPPQPMQEPNPEQPKPKPEKK